MSSIFTHTLTLCANYTNHIISASVGLISGLILSRICSPGPFDAKIAESAEETFLEAEGENKLVLVIRTDLGMGKGKVAAQCAHAAVGCYKRALKHQPNILAKWEYSGQPKITLKIDSEDAFFAIAEHARSIGLIQCVIHDAGRTQIESGTATVVGIGPGPASVINTITGHLKLY